MVDWSMADEGTQRAIGTAQRVIAVQRLGARVEAMRNAAARWLDEHTEPSVIEMAQGDGDEKALGGIHAICESQLP